MRGFPVVEGLVAVLDGRKQRGDKVGAQKYVEGGDGLDRVRAVASGGAL